MKKHGTSLRIVDSLPYRTWVEVFTNLILPGTVLDLYPHLGSKLLACCNSGIAYLAVETYRKRFSKISELLPNLLTQIFDDVKLKSMHARIPNMCNSVFGSPAIVDVIDDVDDDVDAGEHPSLSPTTASRPHRGSKRLRSSEPPLGGADLRGKRPRYSFTADGTRVPIDYSGDGNEVQMVSTDDDDSGDGLFGDDVAEQIGYNAGQNVFMENAYDTDNDEDDDVDAV